MPYHNRPHFIDTFGLLRRQCIINPFELGRTRLRWRLFKQCPITSPISRFLPTNEITHIYHTYANNCFGGNLYVEHVIALGEIPYWDLRLMHCVNRSFAIMIADFESWSASDQMSPAIMNTYVMYQGIYKILRSLGAMNSDSYHRFSCINLLRAACR